MMASRRFAWDTVIILMYLLWVALGKNRAAARGSQPVMGPFGASAGLRVVTASSG